MKFVIQILNPIKSGFEIQVGILTENPEIELVINTKITASQEIRSKIISSLTDNMFDNKVKIVNFESPFNFVY